ncbi:hypothetical protein F4861DRAFT_371310 [Xylaria intraflava]|nr:hypothetical protein F4861DRAFT_371310 [Xylaria intraflava]
MSGILDAIGLISGVLGIISFGQDNLPKSNTKGSTVRVTVGLDVSGGLSNAEGDLPDVRLFNEAGDFLGITADPGKVKSGDFGDITVNHENDSGQQASYALFSANNDAICVAYSSITWTSGDQYAWIGDWGKQCGGAWYYSNVYISASGVTPNCLWIDANGDTPQTGFQVHWPEFVDTNGSSIPSDPSDSADKVKYFCNAGPPFKMYKYPDDKDPRSITAWTLSNKRSLSDELVPASEVSYGPPKSPVSAKFQSKEHKRRDSQGLSSRLASSLVLGHSDQHSAQELCSSSTSVGPDLVHLKHGQFCRMSDKTLWPVCDGADVTDNCFNSDLMKLVVNGVAARDEPYNNIIDWTSGFKKQ